MRYFFADIGGIFVERKTVFEVLNSVPDEQSLSGGGGEGADDFNAAAGKPFRERLRGLDGGVYGAAQAERKTYIEYILAAVEHGGEGVCEIVLVRGGGLEDRAVAHLAVEVRSRHLRLRVFGGFSVPAEAQVDASDLPFLQQLRRNIASRVGEKNVVLHI